MYVSSVETPILVIKRNGYAKYHSFKTESWKDLSDILDFSWSGCQ